MELPGNGDDSIADLLEDDPKGTFVGLQLILQQLDEDEAVDAFLLLAELVARKEGVNLIRAMRDHPEHTRDVFGIDPDALGDDLEAKVDAVMD